MDLWIRSQDKMNLVKINQILINYANKTQIIANCLPEYYENSGNYYELLGTYKTEERALEILNEIEERVLEILNETEDLMRSLNSSDLKIIVYEMPEV